MDAFITVGGLDGKDFNVGFLVAPGYLDTGRGPIQERDFTGVFPGLKKGLQLIRARSREGAKPGEFFVNSLAVVDVVGGVSPDDLADLGLTPGLTRNRVDVKGSEQSRHIGGCLDTEDALDVFVGIHFHNVHCRTVLDAHEGFELRVGITKLAEEIGHKVIEALGLLELFVPDVVVDAPFNKLVGDVEDLDVFSIGIKGNDSHV